MTESATKSLTSIADLRRHDGPLYCENRSPFPITCNRWRGKEQINFRLSPAGETGSVDELPKECLMEAGFRRLIMRGDVLVSTDPEMLDRIEIDLQRQVENAVRPGAQVYDSSGNLEAAPMVANPQLNDLVPMNCLESNEIVYQTVAQVNAGIPPLAPRFKHLEQMYVPHPTFDQATGRTKYSWTKTTLTQTVQAPVGGDDVQSRNISNMR